MRFGGGANRTMGVVGEWVKGEEGEGGIGGHLIDIQRNNARIAGN